MLKLEGNNPGGSVKDRAAYNMISQALKRKNIKKGDTLVEATSGNTGIALALMAKVLGVHMVLVDARECNHRAPLVEAQHIFKKEGVTLLLKLEGNNPGGSVKDRAAYNMISQALKRIILRKEIL